MFKVLGLGCLFRGLGSCKGFRVSSFSFRALYGSVSLQSVIV